MNQPVKVKVAMIGGKCGCVACKEGVTGAQLPRTFWKGRQNKHHRALGKLKK